MLLFFVISGLVAFSIVDNKLNVNGDDDHVQMAPDHLNL